MIKHSPANVLKFSGFTRDIMYEHFGKKKFKISMLSGGLSNYVFSVQAGADRFVVRINHNPKILAFVKEQWVVAKARNAGIPVPDILEVGIDTAGNAYMISRMIPGTSAVDHPGRHLIIEEMGRLARTIHGISTTSYGQVFDWCENQLSKNRSFADYLNRELKVEERIRFLQKNRMLPAKMLSKVKAEVKLMYELNEKPVLHHGDLRLKNMMVNDKGEIAAVIDWENAISSIPPYWDLSIALHDLTIDEQVYFLKGYGLTSKKMAGIANFVKVLNILNYAPVIERRMNKGDQEKIDQSRIRLNGMLDMFSL